MQRIINIIIFILSLDLSRGQLNFEGNPLTENTEYTAEESHYSVRQNDDSRQSKKIFEPSTRSHDSYIAAANSLGHPNDELKKPYYPLINLGPINLKPKDTNTNINSISTSSMYSNSINDRQTVQSRDQQLDQVYNPALDNFMNSQTPEESQYALDNYLRSQQQVAQLETSPTISENLYAHRNQQQEMIPVENMPNFQSMTVAPITPVVQAYEQQYHQPWPPVGPQTRRDFFPGAKRRPVYHYQGRLRGRPRVQHRIGHGYVGRGPPVNFPGPFPGPGSGKPPVEVIYTKPPGFNHGPLPVSNPPVSYEDASAFFPESNHLPMSKDVYYSQLYAQSYDPHYYNHIAKTGKIKPWLYGKLGHEEYSDFWSELYSNFKKHGMKNMMNPMFLLGLSIPTLTLLFTAMAQKRSLGRSNSGFMNEEEINEMAEKVREAIECYRRNLSSNTSDC